MNTDEGVYSYNTGTAWQYQRYPWSGGSLNNFTFDTIFIDGSNDVTRWVGYSTTNGVETVSNITFRNVFGTVIVFATTLSAGVTATGPITFDDWGIAGTIYVPPNASPLIMAGLSPATTVSAPSGATPSYEYGPEFFTPVYFIVPPYFEPPASLPTTSAGTMYFRSSNYGMLVTGLSGATSVTLTFSPAWPFYAFCSATANVALTTPPYITSMGTTAVTFTFSSLTGALFVVCTGN
jgi:hypothetical protein